MGYIFHLKRDLKIKICCQILNNFRSFLKILFYFQAFENSYPQERSGKQEKNLKKISSNTDYEIGLWFRFPIPKLGFGRTLVSIIGYWQFYWQF